MADNLIVLPSGDRQRIVTNGRQLHEITTDCLYALLRQSVPIPLLFARGGQVVQIVTDEREHTTITEVTPSDFSLLLTRAADFYNRLPAPGGGTSLVATNPPGKAIAILPSVLVTEADLPPLAGITESPILRLDGSILIAPGYDETSRIFYAPTPGLTIPRIPARPTESDVRAAAAIIGDAIAQFPWRDAASRANFFAMLLTPIVRPFCKCVPIGLLDATSPGTGKSLLAEVLCRITTGSAAGMRAIPASAEEWRKALSAIIRAGNVLCVFDNLDDVLKSGHLAEAVSAETWSDRTLGLTEERSVPQQTCFIVTGNAIRIGGDLSRRCYWVRLDTGAPRPWERQHFKYRDLKTHVSSNRGQLLAALLTMSSGWFVAGQPEPSIPTVGGFERWTATVGGILQYAGVEHFLANRLEMYEAGNPGEAQWTGFLAALHTKFKSKPFTTAELLQHINGTRAALAARGEN